MKCPDCGKVRHSGECEAVVCDDDAPLTDEELRRFDDAVKRTADILFPTNS